MVKTAVKSLVAFQLNYPFVCVVFKSRSTFCGSPDNHDTTDSFRFNND